MPKTRKMKRKVQAAERSRRYTYSTYSMGGKRFKTPKEEDNILRLPSHITLEILSRLPVKTIIHCSTVCKAWHTLLLDPCFPQLHLAKSPVNLMLYAHPTCRLIEFEKDFRKRKLSKFNFKSECVLASDQVYAVGSCNGLICLKAVIDKKEHYYVWNPVKNENVILPMPNLISTEKYFVSSPSGFGFCPRTNVYKVIRMVKYGGMAMCEVCTLGANAWIRTMQDVPVPYHSYSHKIDIHAFNGALHWFNDENFPIAMCAFRIEDERWDPILLPLSMLDNSAKLRYRSELGVLENCLAIFEKSHGLLNIWMMKEYGVRESWTKCWSIEIKRTVEMKYAPSLLPLKLTKEGDLLMYDESNEALVCFNPKMRLITRRQRIYGLRNFNRRHRLFGHRNFHPRMSYVASFISPTQVMKEEC